MGHFRSKTLATYDIVPGPAASGIEDTDYPYYHVSNHPEVPSIHEGTKRDEGNYFDPLGLYLFPKGKRVSVEEWQDKKYRWDAKLKPGTKLLAVDKVTRHTIQRIADKVGLPMDREVMVSPNKDMSLNQIIVDGVEQFWFYAIKHYVGDRKKLTKIFQDEGYDGLSDLSGDTLYVYQTEPQIVVFDPNKIEWLEREENERDSQVYKLRAASDELEFAVSWLRMFIGADPGEGA